MGVPVIATVSEKRIWVEKTISSLDQGFDKKKLLESADNPQQVEIARTAQTGLGERPPQSHVMMQPHQRLAETFAPAGQHASFAPEQ